MDMKSVNVGVALTGSFCNLHMAFEIIKELKKLGANVTPIISYNVDRLNTKFFKAKEVKDILTELTGKEIIKEITESEPIGPTNMFDVLLVAPATGNTIAKFACAITDTPVLMAIKSQLRNKKPVVIAISTNDGLGNNAANIGKLMNMENVFFVPFAQDSPSKKEMSVVFLQHKAIDALHAALNKNQLQPMIVTNT